MFDSYPSRQDAIQQAQDHATPLNNLITPQEVDPEAQVWADVDDDDIRRECAESAEIIATEHRTIRNLIQDRAFRIWLDALKRVNDDALAEDVPLTELIHVYNLWPFTVDKWEVLEEAEKVFSDPNYKIPNDCYDEAREAVIRGLMEGTKPDA
jgi:hypothetical protein